LLRVKAVQGCALFEQCQSIFEGSDRMKPKKVVLWGHNEVLEEAFETFLTAHQEWEVVKVTDEESPRMFMEQMEAAGPDVIIIYETKYANVTIFPYALLHTHPEIKVITVSLENTFMEVFDKHRVWVNQISDLFSAIEA
jgi:hypothetical protein